MWCNKMSSAQLINMRYDVIVQVFSDEGNLECNIVLYRVIG